jgi:hypothetical protein
VGTQGSSGRHTFQRFEGGNCLLDNEAQEALQPVHGDHAFGLHFAKQHMDGPLIGTRATEAVTLQIDAFADSHAVMAKQQHHVAWEIVPA